MSKMDTISMKNGLANRFLWVLVERSKLLPFGGNVHDIDFAPVLEQLRAAVDFARTEVRLNFDADASALWSGEYSRLSSVVPGLIGEVTARAEAQVLRLALLYAVLDCSRFIRTEHLKAALAVWKYCEQSAAHIFGDSLGNAIADTVLKELRTRSEGLRRTEINYLLGHNRNAKEITHALNLLLERRLAFCVKKKTKGRPEERWFASEFRQSRKETN